MQQKILVLEDDLALSAGLCFELDSAGYLTVAAYNCQKARQLLKGDYFDLALLDVNLPDGNGFDQGPETGAAGDFSHRQRPGARCAQRI